MKNINYLAAASVVLSFTACSSILGDKAYSSQFSTELVSPQVSQIQQLSQAPPQQQFPDRFISSGTMRGNLIHFYRGDYLHAVLGTDEGEAYFFFVFNGNQACFLAQNKDAKLWIQYDEVERYLPEPNSYYPVTIIRTIRTEQTDFATWLQRVTPAELERCPQLIDRYTRPSENAGWIRI